MQNVLIVGSGGREHALGWSLAKLPDIGQMWFAPGNAGTRLLPNSQNVPIDVEDIAVLSRFCREHRPDLVVVGPEVPLSLGLADNLRAIGLRVFGPGAAGARIEASKVWAKDFMQRHGIPTAARHVFTDLQATLDYISHNSPPFVLKADGLAAGKGVLVTADPQAAQAFAREVMQERVFGASGAQLLIEEFMQGQEVSQLAFCDTQSQTIVPLEPACDYKRAKDNDEGLNTGGMGAYSPTRLMSDAMRQRVLHEILEPALRGFVAEGIDYRGTLYAGLMLTADGPKVVEFNCRFGDPETQVILPRLQTDLLKLLTLVADGQLAQAPPLAWDSRVSVGVVLVADGYPGAYAKNLPVYGLETLAADPALQLFHAGTQFNPQNQIVTNGGRVFNLIATDETIALARQRVYNTLAKREFGFDGLFYRHDIALREE